MPSGSLSGIRVQGTGFAGTEIQRSETWLARGLVKSDGFLVIVRGAVAWLSI